MTDGAPRPPEQPRRPNAPEPPPSSPAPPGPPPAANLPAQPYPAQPYPAKKRRIWLWVLLAVGIPLLLIGGCVAAIVFAVQGPIDAGNEYLVLLDERRWDDAYDALPTACRAESEQAFVDIVSPLDITDYSLTSSSTQGSTGQTSGTITLSTGETIPIEFDVVKTEGDWHVCGFSFGSAVSG